MRTSSELVMLVLKKRLQYLQVADESLLRCEGRKDHQCSQLLSWPLLGGREKKNEKNAWSAFDSFTRTGNRVEEVLYPTFSKHTMKNLVA
jgi:hypothetical protein